MDIRDVLSLAEPRGRKIEEDVVDEDKTLSEQSDVDEQDDDLWACWTVDGCDTLYSMPSALRFDLRSLDMWEDVLIRGFRPFKDIVALHLKQSTGLTTPPEFVDVCRTSMRAARAVGCCFRIADMQVE